MIHLILDGGEWEVWTDTDDGERDGRCLASCKDKGKALALAGKELQDDLEQLATFAGLEAHAEGAKGAA